MRRLVIVVNANGGAYQSYERRNPAPSGYKTAYSHDDTCGQRKCFPGSEQSEKDLFKLRDHDDHNQRDRPDCDRDNGRRIYRCRNDAAFQLDDLFDQGCKTLKDKIQHTARFTGFDHVNEKAVENLGVLFERRKQRAAFLDTLSYLAQNVLEVNILLLFAEDVDTLNQRQTGVDHH